MSDPALYKQIGIVPEDSLKIGELTIRIIMIYHHKMYIILIIPHHQYREIWGFFKGRMGKEKPYRCDETIFSK